MQKFMFNGRLIFGPDAKSIVVTLLLILVPIVTFCSNVARNLLHEVSTYTTGYAIMGVAIMLTVYVSSSKPSNVAFGICYSVNSTSVLKG